MEHCCDGLVTLPHMCRCQSSVIDCPAAHQKLQCYRPMNVREPTSLGTVAINSSPHVTLSEVSVGQGVRTLGKTDQETTVVGRLAHSRLLFS